MYFKPIQNYVYKGRCRTDADIPKNGTQEAIDASRLRSMSMPISSVTSNDIHEQNGIDRIDSEPANQQGDHSPDQTLTKTTSPEPRQEEEEDDGSVVLPPMNEEPANDWIKIEDNFHTILISHQPLLGPELLTAPEATMNDGLMYLLMIRAPMKRMRMVNVMGQLADGSHLKNPDIEVVPIKAFRIVPSPTVGHLVVDGEKVSYGPLQGQVLSGKARLMAL